MEIKSCRFELKALEENIIEGYASIFGNVDSHSDIVEKGAFTRTLNNNGNRIKMLWQHDIYSPIGKPLQMEQDSKGLYVKAKISMTETGKMAYELVKDRVIDELSIGYETIISEWDNLAKIRRLKEVKLYEFSLVTLASNQLAKVTGVKNLENIINEIDNRYIKSGRSISASNRDMIQSCIDKLMALITIEDPEDPEDDLSTLGCGNTPNKPKMDSNLYHSILEQIKKYK